MKPEFFPISCLNLILAIILLCVGLAIGNVFVIVIGASITVGVLALLRMQGVK